MQDLVGLLIAFVVGFFMKHLLGTVCQSRLVEGKLIKDGGDEYKCIQYGGCFGNSPSVTAERCKNLNIGRYGRPGYGDSCHICEDLHDAPRQAVLRSSENTYTGYASFCEVISTDESTDESTDDSIN